MSNKKFVDQEGTTVEVLETRTDSLGNVDSYFVRRGNHTLWVHAHELTPVATSTMNVTVADQPVVPERNTMLNPKRIINKVWPWKK